MIRRFLVGQLRWKFLGSTFLTSAHRAEDPTDEDINFHLLLVQVYTSKKIILKKHSFIKQFILLKINDITLFKYCIDFMKTWSLMHVLSPFHYNHFHKNIITFCQYFIKIIHFETWIIEIFYNPALSLNPLFNPHNRKWIEIWTFVHIK